jgi:hypothetical protein
MRRVGTNKRNKVMYFDAVILVLCRRLEQYGLVIF